MGPLTWAATSFPGPNYRPSIGVYKLLRTHEFRAHTRGPEFPLWKPPDARYFLNITWVFLGWIIGRGVYGEDGEL